MMISTGTPGPRPMSRLTPVRLPSGTLTSSVRFSVAPITRSRISAEILDRVIGATENRTIEVRVPLGNLTGVSLLMGRGPGVPVEIIMLTSSHVEFQNRVVTAGINQTKHQINLEIIVDIDTLIPWGTESAQVVTEVMIADVVVVGKVPSTYMNMQQ